MEKDPNIDAEMFRAVFDALPSMIFVVDDDVRIQDYNAAVAEFLKAPQTAVLKRRGGEVMHCLHSTDTAGGCGRAPSCHTCIIRGSVDEAFAGARVVRRRTRMEIVKNGETVEIYALVTATPFHYDGQPLALLVIEDISVIAELQRMIPICSVCRKIRDQNQSWSRVEAYFKENWDVNFTHGLCPDCFDKEQTKLDELIKRSRR